MPYQSPYEPLEIPKCNILSYLFPTEQVSNKPLWIDVSNTSNSLSLAQMLSYIKRFALGLDRLGVDEGETIMVFTPNHIYVPMAYLGAAGSKRYFTGANPTYTVTEVAHQMKILDIALVFIHPSLLDTGLTAAKEANIPTNRIFQFSDTVSTTVNNIPDWRTMIVPEAEAQAWQWDPLEGDASSTTVAAINFSSGTTGLPKGVCISHRNLIANTMQVIFNKFEGTEYSPEKPPSERWLAFLPLYHAYSQLWTINIACKLQVPIYVMQKFIYKEFLHNLEKFLITTIQGVPPVIVMLSKRPETSEYNTSSLKYILSGAAPLSAELQNEVSSRFDLVIAQGWGMTETTCAGIMIPGMVKDQTGSIGYLLPNTEAILVDDEGNEVLDGPGELWLRGPQIMLRYWKNSTATKESLNSNGWFKTGDVAVCKGSKWWIVDRKKELIKVNGLQVAPAELEACLLEHEGIADAAVVGMVIDDEELPRAYVVRQKHAKLTASRLMAFVASKVAKHKRLRGGVVFVDEIPKLPSGKIVRKLIKEWAKEDAKRVTSAAKSRL